jgi:DNA modification methylase
MIDRITEQPFCQTRVMCRAVDNLELLLSQPDESVDLIYCDILYGTGKDFMDYKDLYPMREIIEEHYLPRLKEMHRVLKKYRKYLFANGLQNSSLGSMFNG